MLYITHTLYKGIRNGYLTLLGHVISENVRSTYSVVMVIVLNVIKMVIIVWLRVNKIWPTKMPTLGMTMHVLVNKLPCT